VSYIDKILLSSGSHISIDEDVKCISWFNFERLKFPIVRLKKVILSTKTNSFPPFAPKIDVTTNYLVKFNGSYLHNIGLTHFIYIYNPIYRQYSPSSSSTNSVSDVLIVAYVFKIGVILIKESYL
jgi:hypothetical protein